MKITINGEERVFNKSLRVCDLLSELQLDPEKIAIEHNLEIVPCSEYENTEINEGDNIEIVNFIGGG